MALLLARNSMILGRQFARQAQAVRRAASVTPVRATAGQGETEGRSVVGKGVLAERLAQEQDLSKKKAGEIIDALLDDIMLSVAEGQTVTIPGFGSFKKRHRAARKGRNPQTGEELSIAASDSPGFSAGTVFKGVVKAGSWEEYDKVAAATKAKAASKKK